MCPPRSRAAATGPLPTRHSLGHSSCSRSHSPSSSLQRVRASESYALCCTAPSSTASSSSRRTQQLRPWQRAHSKTKNGCGPTLMRLLPWRRSSGERAGPQRVRRGVPRTPRLLRPVTVAARMRARATQHRRGQARRRTAAEPPLRRPAGLSCEGGPGLGACTQSRPPAARPGAYSTSTCASSLMLSSKQCRRRRLPGPQTLPSPPAWGHAPLNLTRTTKTTVIRVAGQAGLALRPPLPR